MFLKYTELPPSLLWQYLSCFEPQWMSLQDLKLRGEKKKPAAVRVLLSLLVKYWEMKFWREIRLQVLPPSPLRAQEELCIFIMEKGILVICRAHTKNQSSLKST